MILQPQTIEDIKANREEWAALLGSGKYQQGDGRLLDIETGSYCCLGVLADAVDPKMALWEPHDGFPDDQILRIVAINMKSERYLEDADFASDESQAELLANANDTGAIFPEISAMIRALPLPTEVLS